MMPGEPFTPSQVARALLQELHLTKNEYFKTLSEYKSHAADTMPANEYIKQQEQAIAAIVKSKQAYERQGATALEFIRTNCHDIVAEDNVTDSEIFEIACVFIENPNIKKVPDLKLPGEVPLPLIDRYFRDAASTDSLGGPPYNQTAKDLLNQIKKNPSGSDDWVTAWKNHFTSSLDDIFDASNSISPNIIPGIAIVSGLFVIVTLGRYAYTKYTQADNSKSNTAQGETSTSTSSTKPASAESLTPTDSGGDGGELYNIKLFL